MTDRLTKAALQSRVGVMPGTPGHGVNFGPKSRAGLSRLLSNPRAPALTPDDLQSAAERLGVPVGHIRGVRKVEAPRGAYDDQGRPTMLYERHKFRAATVPPGRFDSAAPDLSGGPYGPSGYGPYSGQFDKFARACDLDPDAAFRACSWGAFQVMGGNAEALGYLSPIDMVLSLVKDEAGHVETFVRFVEVNGLVDEFRACRAGDPNSCVPFVSRYNGTGFKAFNYHVKLSDAIG